MHPSEFAAKYGVTVEFKYIDYRDSGPAWNFPHDLWEVTLTANGKDFYADYKTGVLVDNPEDECAVLHSLSGDAHAGEMGFEEFASDFGMSPDDEATVHCWKACRKARRGLYAWTTSQEMWDDFLTLEY